MIKWCLWCAFLHKQTETISSLVRCLICWTPKQAATRSCPNGPNQHPTPPCATWRWRILCVQGKQLLSEAGIQGLGLWELLLHPTIGSPDMQDTSKKRIKRPILFNQNWLLPKPCLISFLTHQHNFILIMHCHSSWLSVSKLAPCFIVITCLFTAGGRSVMLLSVEKFLMYFHIQICYLLLIAMWEL